MSALLTRVTWSFIGRKEPGYAIHIYDLPAFYLCAAIPATGVNEFTLCEWVKTKATLIL
jgi:hypothetical protein